MKSKEVIGHPNYTIREDGKVTRKDGVYSFRGNLWVVKSNKFLAYCKYSGEVLQRFGAFDTQIGDFRDLYISDRKKKLTEWLWSQ